MLGPFPRHEEALARVAEVRAFADKHDRSGRSHFFGWGTLRMADDVTRPGNLNKHLLN